MTQLKLLIDGELVEGDEWLDVINPATEEVFTTVSKASRNQAEQAIAAAKYAFPNWANTAVSKRQSSIAALAEAIEQRSDELARSLTLEQGKPLAEAAMEVEWTIGYLRHFSELEPVGRVIQDDATCRIEVRRQPLGVVGAIVAWNFPLLMACWKIGPAVVTGNTIVLKPAPTTPVTTLLLGEICQVVFPAGVVNIIVDNNDLGPLLTSHSSVAKVSFTGSTPTGRKIMLGASNSLKRLTLELGGNDAGIVLKDVDVVKTSVKLFEAAFLNCGQVCLALKRLYVHESIIDEMCDALGDLANAAEVGDGLKQQTDIGPIQNRRQYEKVKIMLASAESDGTIIAGGEVMDRVGYFIRPTIVRDVTDGHQIVDEEQFGPILPVIAYSDLDEVIERANRSPYGLGGSVWASDLDAATVVAGCIQAGTVWVNQHINIGPHIPMAGFKQSGIGVEMSLEGLEEFTQIQVINIARMN